MTQLQQSQPCQSRKVSFLTKSDQFLRIQLFTMFLMLVLPSLMSAAVFRKIFKLELDMIYLQVVSLPLATNKDFLKLNLK